MVVLEHPIVAVIYYVKVARRVNRDSAWRGQAAGADTGAFGRRETAAGAKDLLCRRAGGERSVVFEHAAVGAVLDINIARVVRGHGGRTAQAVGAAPAEIAFLRREASTLAKDRVGRGVTGAAFAATWIERSVILQHPLVVDIGDV